LLLPFQVSNFTKSNFHEFTVNDGGVTRPVLSSALHTTDNG